MRWQAATVVETIAETVTAVTLRLRVPAWPGHRAGQHVDIRLTAASGYSAVRSYAIASPPGAEHVELTIQGHIYGEVSAYLTTMLQVGDEVELRGPLGGYFVWEPEDAGPVLLVGGGAGLVPLMAMPRQHQAIDHEGAMRLVYSARTPERLLYGNELDGLVSARRAVTVTLTRHAPAQWPGRRGRVDAKLLGEIGWPPALDPRCFVAGPTPFVETVSSALVALGHRTAQIRTERLGPAGPPPDRVD